MSETIILKQQTQYLNSILVNDNFNQTENPENEKNDYNAKTLSQDDDNFIMVCDKNEYCDKINNENLKDDETYETSELRDVDNYISNYLQHTAASLMGISIRNLDDHSISLVKIGMNEMAVFEFLKKIANILPIGINIENSFIEKYPNIDSITKFIMDIVRQPKINDQEIQEQQQLIIEDIVDKYSLYIKSRYIHSKNVSRKNQQNEKRSKTFLLTGATGFLGAHILNILLNTTSSYIYCLLKKKSNRTPKASLKRVFLRNNLDTSLIDSDKLIAIYANLSEPHFGLMESEYENLSQKVTTIIHGSTFAKPGAPLSVYENSILGTANLLLFCAKKEFHFISNIDACVNGPWDYVPEGILPLKASITNMDGFGLSKLATETIITNTFYYLYLERTSIIRTGQISSHTETGVWNPNEWVPLILGNAGLTGKMPTFEANLDWIPVDIASKSIVDLITRDTSFNIEVFHISNPKPTITWEQYLDKLKEFGMKFTREELSIWLENLWKDVENDLCDKNLCLLLTRHFENMTINDSQKSRALLDLTSTQSRTSLLSECPSLLDEDIRKNIIKINIDWLRSTGYLSETTLHLNSLQPRSKFKLRNNLKNVDQGLWGWFTIIVPLMVFFFVINILWNILSENFLQVTFISGFFVAAVFSDDSANNRNEPRTNKKRVAFRRKIKKF
ncbi:5678_t:CDS:1 [Diversispora eburnea]|uniref:5678_t:CDS:1 n=1 Tax=Diversispora eburnea TaxID=1213867 RepID=A0A9N8UUR8_9GLOM|nr:5678_t:CDS:1 [Diversispora eburnea]